MPNKVLRRRVARSSRLLRLLRKPEWSPTSTLAWCPVYLHDYRGGAETLMHALAGDTALRVQIVSFSGGAPLGAAGGRGT
jgi:hypothetical protein